MGLFCFCAFASFCLVRNDLWLGIVDVRVEVVMMTAFSLQSFETEALGLWRNDTGL